MQFRSAECDLAYLVPVFLQRDGYAERDYAKVSRLSVRDVQVDVCFFSHRLEYFEHNFTAE